MAHGDWRDNMSIGPSPELLAGEGHLNVAFGPTPEFLAHPSFEERGVKVEFIHFNGVDVPQFSPMNRGHKPE